MGQLKAKLAKLKRELLTPSSSGGGGPGVGFDVARTGVASVGFVGCMHALLPFFSKETRGQRNNSESYTSARISLILSHDVSGIGSYTVPSVGKSSLMSGLTGTVSAVAAYEFTTL